MSRFVKKTVERFELGDGDWVDLLTQLSYGDRALLEQKLIAPAMPGRPPADPSGPAPEQVPEEAKEASPVELATAAANLELLRLAVRGWGGPGFCDYEAHPHDGACRIRPITPENLEALDETAEKILLELQRRLAKPTKGFTKRPSRSTSTGAQAGSSGKSSRTSKSAR